MAKSCGCAGDSCSCLIQAGTNAQVRGKGTTSDPYIVSVSPLSLVVVDSETVDLTLGGDGSTTNPYTLKAEYIGALPVADQQPSVFQNWAGAVNLSAISGPTTIRATLNGNVTSVALPTWGSTVSGSITLYLSQDATGGRTWIMPGVSAYGIDIVLSTAPNAKDLVVAFWTGTAWIMVASALNVS